MVTLEFIGTTGHLINFYITLCSLRIYLSYFPNINIYYQPMTTIRWLVDPYFGFISGLFPDTPMIDFSAIFAFMMLDLTRDWCFATAARNKLPVLPLAVQQFGHTLGHLWLNVNLFLDGLIDKVFPGLG